MSIIDSDKTLYVSRYWVKKPNTYDIYKTSFADAGFTLVWRHIALVLKANNAQFTVYQDGTEIGTKHLSRFQNRAPSSGNVVIGSKNATQPPSSLGEGITATAAPWRYGVMTLDELVMWNYTITASQVSQIYTMGTA